ncbi:MAG: serine/threonine protein kinase [Thermoguttaceae bacterium]|nr:serine/threonine protein kinase [Thermoguttaceae bacterium]
MSDEAPSFAPSFDPNEPTIDTANATPESRVPQRARGRCTYVSLVTGSTPEISCELEGLLRRRLRMAAGILFLGFAAFLAWHVVRFGVDVDEVFGGGWLAFHALVTAALGGVAGLLFRRCPLPLLGLRTCEIVVFGLPAAFIAAAQYEAAVEAAPRGHLVLEAGPWLLLLFTYALFIPNTFRRAAVALGILAAIPLTLLLVLDLSSADVAELVTVDHVVRFGLMMVCAAVAGAMGVDTIGTLRREAFEARQVGQYRLSRQIGAGGMGEVYLAEHQMLKRPCVIKLIRPDKAGDPRVLARFQREVRAAARLTHWNTIEIFDYGNTEDGTFYYVMEYLPGLSLADLVAHHGPLPPERVIYLLRQACDALREAHGAGLVHRDIKPANIFVAQRGGVYDVVKLLDFGLVKPIADDLPMDLTTEGAITGSPLYMSPEQAAGDREADARSDIYSLGAVGYYLLTGRPPFVGDKPIKVMAAHIHEEVVPPSQHRPGIPADLEQVILRCLAKSPEDRFSDAASLCAALSRCEAADGWSREHAARWWRGIDRRKPNRVEVGV